MKNLRKKEVKNQLPNDYQKIVEEEKKKPQFEEIIDKQPTFEHIEDSNEKMAFKTLENQKFLEIFEKVFDFKSLPLPNLSNELNISDFSNKIGNANHMNEKVALNDETKESLQSKDFNNKNYANIETFLWNTPNRRMIKESPVSHNNEQNFNFIYDQFSTTIATKNTDKVYEKRDDFVVENPKLEQCNNKEFYSPNKYIANFESPSRLFHHFLYFFQ